LANGDHLRVPETPSLDALARELDRRRAERHGGEGEDWRTWWEAVRTDPDLSDAVAARERLAYEHPDASENGLAVHEQALREAGFSEIGVLWRKGTDAVLAALRGGWAPLRSAG
jgi:hypothetical protein